MKKIYVDVDVATGTIYVKQGRFGATTKFCGEWYTNCSMNEVVATFCNQLVQKFEKEISRVIKK